MHWFETRHPDTGQRLVVELLYRPPYRGQRDRYGAPEEPDEPGGVEIARVTNGAGEEIDSSSIEDFLENEVAKRWRWQKRVKFF